MGNRYLDFWDRVRRGAADDCWLWVGSVGKNGYGKTTLKYRTISAHRLSWIKTNGEIPLGKIICHKCDNMLCVNPSHLYLGTHKQNTDDMIRRGRGKNQKKTHCPHGHALVGANVGLKINCRGVKTRYCKTCKRAWDAKRKARLRESNI